MTRRILCLALLSALLTPVWLYPMLRQRLENDDELKVGDRFQLIISGDTSLRKAVIPDTLTQFTVIQTDTLAQGTEPAALRLTIVPLRLGRLTFPRLRIIPEVAQAESLITDAFRINVLPVRAEGDTLLRDITPVQRYRLELPWWVYWAIVGFILALVIAIIVLFLTNRSKPEPLAAEPPPSPDTRPPWRIALEELAELIAQDLLSQGQYIVFHYRLSLILRHYLELEHKFPAMEMTTSEIRQYIRAMSQSITASIEIMDFLSYCDKVKFAKYETDKERTEQRVEWLKQFLLMPAPELKDESSSTSPATEVSVPGDQENGDA